jgi:hypothetical protein
MNARQLLAYRNPLARADGKVSVKFWARSFRDGRFLSSYLTLNK